MFTLGEVSLAKMQAISTVAVLSLPPQGTQQQLGVILFAVSMHKEPRQVKPQCLALGLLLTKLHQCK
jgi:hypothetical protein